jgi:hypothetical protein
MTNEIKLLFLLKKEILYTKFSDQIADIADLLEKYTEFPIKTRNFRTSNFSPTYFFAIWFSNYFYC